MKKGTAVKFIGAKNKQPIEKTFIWATASVEQGEIYLIEHPDGVLLTEENRKEFEGFNPEKLQTGRKYLVAYSGELIDLSQPTELTTNNQPSTSEAITVTMPKEYFENIVGFMEAQKKALQENPMLAKLQLGKEGYNDMVSFYQQIIDDTNKALAQQQTKALDQQPLTPEALAKGVPSNM